MRRVRRCFIECVAFGLAVVACVAPAFAARAIQGSVGQVSLPDGAALGQVGFRIWSALPGGETSINDNVASCRNVRCIRSYVTNALLSPGGYVGNQEATQVYNGDLVDQPFYELVDVSMNDTAGNHIGFYGVSGVTANSEGVGSFLAPGCPPPGAQNCFGRIDSDDAGPILNNTLAAYGAGPHQIRPIAGLNPIPVPTVMVAGSCPSGQICMDWIDPSVYAANMRPSTSAPAPPSPVKGVRLYKLQATTSNPPAADDPGWTPLATFDLGQTTAQDQFPEFDVCNFYALKVRLVGPGGDDSEIETFRIGANSQAICNQPCGGGPFSPGCPVRIARFDANYAGHGIVNVSWATGLEAGLLGFYVTRGLSSSGPFERVSELVRALGEGSAYAWSDQVPTAARTYYYRLDVLNRDGSVETSGTAAVARPARSRRLGPRVR